MFITNEKWPVNDDKGNTIWIKSKMSFADNGRVETALMQLRVKADTSPRKNSQNEEDEDVNVEVSVAYSAQKLALLQVCIVDWDGPDFTDTKGRKIACNSKNRERLDPNEPLVEKVLEEIDKRNSPPEDDPEVGDPPDPNSDTPPTSEE